jgi:pyridoxal 5'-phosphate synthase pdxT subunit
MRVGILAFHGDVIEHHDALTKAAAKLKIRCMVVQVRQSKDLEKLDGLIIPGGESTHIYKLCMREGMVEGIRKIPNIFGTCAGAIMLAKKIHGAEEGQKTLDLMDIEIDRNAYGSQIDSFEQDISTTLGPIHAIFIRAPKIKKVGPKVRVISHLNKEIVACDEKVGSRYYRATCFHPELSTTKFHEYFLEKLA